MDIHIINSVKLSEEIQALQWAEPRYLSSTFPVVWRQHLHRQVCIARLSSPKVQKDIETNSPSSKSKIPVTFLSFPGQFFLSWEGGKLFCGVLKFSAEISAVASQARLAQWQSKCDHLNSVQFPGGEGRGYQWLPRVVRLPWWLYSRVSV